MRPEEEWKPIGIPDLESNAWEALRSLQNARVLAGPGAGKTEFLTQRAIYLLQTGLCPRPFKILAISFKKDAARTLADRIALRIGRQAATQVNSKTFDSFCKGLLDQFISCVPSYWRPSKHYEIIYPNRQFFQQFLNEARQNCPSSTWENHISQINPNNFERDFIARMPLPECDFGPTTPQDWVTKYWWESALRSGEKSYLTFGMINRLTHLLLNSNRQILGALRETYPFVFMDEFQDTTHGQYEVLQTAFQNTACILTAVGDEKQRIMAWAGAKPDVSASFITDFSAKPISLLCNYRSNPSLVSIQYAISKALEADAVQAKAMVEHAISNEVAQIWHCQSSQHEAAWIAHWVSADIAEHGLGPRDYGILVRQRAEDFEGKLQAELSLFGLRLRNESRKIGETTLQNMLAEEITQVVIYLVRLAIGGKNVEAWNRTIEALLDLRNVGPSDSARTKRVQMELSGFIGALNRKMADWSVSSSSATRLLKEALDFLDLQSVRECYPQYSSGDDLENIVDAISLHLEELAGRNGSWELLWDDFEGVGQIPLMTVHKSKGMEFNTVIFLGLDDTQWWSHKQGDHESLATFFVAFSRAKQRAFFTYRVDKPRQKVADLFDLMASANVPEVIVPEIIV